MAGRGNNCTKRQNQPKGGRGGGLHCAWWQDDKLWWLLRKLNKSKQKVDEGEDGTVPCDEHDSGRASQCEYRWKRRIPASRSEWDKTAHFVPFFLFWRQLDVFTRFGEIIQAGGKRKDREFGDQILSFDFNSDNEASRWVFQPEIKRNRPLWLQKRTLIGGGRSMRKTLWRNWSKFLESRFRLIVTTTLRWWWSQDCEF